MMSEMYSALVIKISNYKIIAYLQSVSLILKVIVSTGNMTQVHVTWLKVSGDLTTVLGDMTAAKKSSAAQHVYPFCLFF